MQKTGYRKSLGSQDRKFWEDYDLLPPEYRKMLYESNTQPDNKDLKAAWEMAVEAGGSGMAAIRRNLNVFEEEIKKEDKKAADLAREQAKRQKSIDRWNNRYGRKVREVYVRIDPNRDDKHARLIARVKAETLDDLISKRKENADIKPASPYYVRRFIEVTPKQEKELKFMEFEPQDSPLKSRHNGGGKK